MTEVQLSVSFPLDSDGFLRRRCPTCDRDFKWFESDESAEAPPGGCYCPCCGIQAHEWFTRAQAQLIQQAIQREIFEPAIEKVSKALADAARQSHGLLQYEGSRDPRRTDHGPLTEDNDMRRIDFECHPEIAVKVGETWENSVYCLLCGYETSS